MHFHSSPVCSVDSQEHQQERRSQDSSPLRAQYHLRYVHAKVLCLVGTSLPIGTCEQAALRISQALNTHVPDA